MGTSKNRDKLRPSIPLIPDWIDPAPIPDEPLPVPNDQEPQDENNSPENDEPNFPFELPANRFNQALRTFKKAVASPALDRPLLTRVVKTYVRQGGGGSKALAQRMRRSSLSVVRFGEIVSGIRENGVQSTLNSFNLQQFAGGGVVDILSALMDIVCGDGAILDDAITKMAYANTIVKIDEQNPGLNLDNLTQQQTNEMMAIFLEETIVYRLLSDVGRSLTINTSDFEKSRQIEEELFQIVNGLVNGIITPLLSAAITASVLQKKIDSIYEIAFQTIINS